MAGGDLELVNTFTIIVGEDVEPISTSVTYEASLRRFGDAVALIHRLGAAGAPGSGRRVAQRLVSLCGRYESSNCDGDLYILSRTRSVFLPPAIEHQPADGFFHSSSQDDGTCLFGFARLFASDIYSRRCRLLPDFPISSGLVCRLTAVEREPHVSTA